MDWKKDLRTNKKSSELEPNYLRNIFFIQNHELIQKAEELRNEYYTLKMTPRPKIDLDNIMKDIKKKM